MASVLLRDDWIQPRSDTPIPTFRNQQDVEIEPTSSERQITIVLFGVDEITSSKPELQAIWFASFEPPDKSIHLLGIAVDTPLDENKGTLKENFTLFEPPDFGAGFLTSLSRYAPHPIQGFVVLDEEGFADVIDYVGGVTLDSQELNGTAAVGALSLVKAQPLASLRMQARIMSSLAQNAALIGSTPELTPLTRLIPDHAYTSPSPYQLASLGSQLLPIDPSNVTIEIGSSN
ncbi:MAG: hypothetical protein PVH60_06310 [Anaerolineales bacterium]